MNDQDKLANLERQLERSGFFTHNGLSNQDHPFVCRKYSCANDARIWSNFEKMELNQEWIENNLSEPQIQLKQIYMIQDEQVEPSES